VVARGDTVDLSNPQLRDSIFIAANSDVPDTIANASGVVITRRAEFQLKRTITVFNPGAGSGTVTVDSCAPSGLAVGSLPIAGGGTVVFNVAQNDTVVISAASTDVFEGFNGDNDGTPTSITVAVNGNQSLTATFKQALTLTITWIGVGTGGVRPAIWRNPPLPFIGIWCRRVQAPPR
jgi:hypothetical protein